LVAAQCSATKFVIGGYSQGAKTRSFCGSTDSVCGGSRNSNVTGGHLSYTTNGAVDQAATFAAAKINGGS
jgi:hypothetical protein